MGRNFTAGLGDATCAICLGAITGGLIASRSRRAKSGVIYIEGFAHADCALDSSSGGWVIDVTKSEVA